ncbi:MAG TPA: putative baseplate assembly protein [Mycobacteriales bacterium]|nr:putative baseplate assembly protein [Mycobacteriales bacterium]
MTEPAWWGRDAEGRGARRTVPGPGPSGVQPELVDASRDDARAAVRDRIPGYTPDWTNPDRADAGTALVALFGTLLAPVLTRVNRLPEKLLVTELQLAGIEPLPPTPAAALLQFTVTPPDGRSVLVPAGYQAGAQPAGGQGDQVIFETADDLWATPAALRLLVVEEAGRRQPVSVGAAGPSGPVVALGDRPRPGNALWIGLSVSAAAGPFPALSLGVQVTEAPVPSPGSAGGPSVPPPPAPLLRWDLLDGDRLRPVDVTRDGTDSLRHTGVVELRLPGGWRPSTPGSGPAAGVRWLRVSLSHGEYSVPPVLTGLRLNMVPAAAVRTIRNEALEQVPGAPADGRTRLRLSRVPIVPGSIRLAVDDDTDLVDPAPADTPLWREVESLAGRGPDERVFTVDHETGIVTFGDGVHGRVVRPGFRTVRAVTYQVGGGAAGRVAAGAVNALVTSLPFVTAVTNPAPAIGGADAEPQPAALRRGAAQLRARGRAVAAADYGLLALRAPGAEVARAQGFPGLDVAHPGTPAPGTVGVLVVPPVLDPTTPPLPSSATLQAVADHLTATVAPVGVRVVTAAPRYARVRVEAWVVLDPDAERADVLQAASTALTTYLDPVAGGEDGGGWPFGGTIRSVALTRQLLRLDGVLAVPRLGLVVDGVRVPACTDQALAPTALLWPDRPLLIPVPVGTVVGGAA